jgi:intraflagellar transport protein 56
LFQYHSNLLGTLENQLSLAAVHLMRTHDQEAIQIFRRLLMQHPEFLALNVYVAVCQFKLEQHDESNEVGDLCLGENGDYARLFNAEIAESQLLQIREFSTAAYDFVDTLITHHLCVSHNGVDGFTLLVGRVHPRSEGRYNLSLRYMRTNHPVEAKEVIRSLQPVGEYKTILRAIVLLALGQMNVEASRIEQASAIVGEIGFI